MIQNAFYYYKNVITPDVCNKIIQLGHESNVRKSLTESEANHDVTIKSRNSLDGGLEDQWMYDLLYPYLNEANSKAKWNFDVDWSETLQFTIYKPGGYYNWHRDAGFDATYAYEGRGKNLDGKIRKISMTLLLNDSKEFKGGDLEFDYGRNDFGKNDDTIETCKEARGQGTLIFFPSFISHRVTPVTKGTRYSLVMWTVGKPFR